jgi:glutathione S-transferase
MIKLYYAPGSVSLASHIALEEAGAVYGAVLMDASARAAGGGRDYLAINPKGRVPALATDLGVLTETLAILAWIAAEYPQAQLMPADSWRFAQAQAFNSYLATTVHVAHAHRYRGYRWATEENSFEDMRRKVPASMTDCFALIERELLAGPWVMGDQFTVCDGYLFTTADWAEGDGVDMTLLPRVMEHRERVRARPAVRKVLAQISA